jgi:hypothetical protein
MPPLQVVPDDIPPARMGFATFVPAAWASRAQPVPQLPAPDGHDAVSEWVRARSGQPMRDVSSGIVCDAPLSKRLAVK